MKDRNGVEITIGAKAVCIGIECDPTGINGRVGVVKKFAPREPDQFMVTNEGEFQWGAWCGANDVVILR